MKKILVKVQKTAAVFLLVLIAIFMISPSVKAAIMANNIDYSQSCRKYKQGEGYYSYTLVYGYDTNGVGLTIITGAAMNDKGWKYKTMVGRSAISSGYEQTGTAWHSYKIGAPGNPDYTWPQN